MTRGDACAAQIPAISDVMESAERTGACLLAKQAESTKNGRLQNGYRGGRYSCVKRKYFFASSRQRDELDMFIPARPIRSARARVIFFPRPEMPPRLARTSPLGMFFRSGGSGRRGAMGGENREGVSRVFSPSCRQNRADRRKGESKSRLTRARVKCASIKPHLARRVCVSPALYRYYHTSSHLGATRVRGDYNSATIRCLQFHPPGV